MKEFIDSLTEQSKHLIAPAQEANKLVLNNLGTLIEIQSQAVSNYAEMGIAQAKAALEIRNSDSLSAFVEQQSEVSEAVQAQFKSDAEKLSELASQTTAGLTDIFSTQQAEELSK